jgi:predicted RNA-binding protein associated with RNAse of E/G family
MMNNPALYRRRYIPDEIIHLKDDIITYMDDDILLTKWNVLKPRNDFTHGDSCYFLKKGYKVSRFYSVAGECIYTYCDIIKTDYDEKENKYVFNDLLIDIIIYPDGFVKVMDIAEIPEALDMGLISIEDAKLALSKTDELLKIIYSGKLEKLMEYFDMGKSL